MVFHVRLEDEEFGREKIPAERVTIGGDFAASSRFDQAKTFVNAEPKIGGRKVAVRRDP